MISLICRYFLDLNVASGSVEMSLGLVQTAFPRRWIRLVGRHHLDHSYVGSMLQLTSPAPDIVESYQKGT
ncbi:MAG: hypothetical protein ACKN9U_25970 [Pirellulaceae bacterium]